MLRTAPELVTSRRVISGTLEVMAPENLSLLRQGETAHVRGLFRGKPLAHPLVHAGQAPRVGVDTSQVELVAMGSDNGIVAIPITPRACGIGLRSSGARRHRLSWCDRTCGQRRVRAIHWSSHQR